MKAFVKGGVKTKLEQHLHNEGIFALACDQFLPSTISGQVMSCVERKTQAV